MGEQICFRRNERLTTVHPQWRGNPVVRGRFFNRQHRYRPGMGSMLKWRFASNPQRKEKLSTPWNPPVNYLHSLDGVVGDSLIWLGHNSFFLQLDGKRILFDPVFAGIPFVRRRSEFPAHPDIFTEIDYLLISHDHFDHLDRKSIARLLRNNPQMKLFCGLGTGQLVKSWFPQLEVVEAGWYQQLSSDSLKITFLPAQHWSKRSLGDGGQRLWGAFLIESHTLSLYYSGDTGYSSHFAEHFQLFGAPDYALVGIGAYKPRWFMRPNHISPSEAVRAAREMQAGLLIPMHYGTFDLSDEPLHDPPHVFAEEAKRHNIRIAIPELGEVVKLKRMKRSSAAHLHPETNAQEDPVG